MHRKNKNELNIINPLNLEDNNEDIVKCTKIMINLSDSDELKILGNQIIDSTVLKKILDENKVIKKHVSSYNDLYEQLALTSNKYSKFEKIPLSIFGEFEKLFSYTSFNFYFKLFLENIVL